VLDFRSGLSLGGFLREALLAELGCLCHHRRLVAAPLVEHPTLVLLFGEGLLGLLSARRSRR
jgi:hypothetical protein